MWKIIVSLIFLSSHVISQDLHIRGKDLPCVNKRFNLIAHIVVDSLRNPGISVGAIQSSINAMNRMFAPICVSFHLCDVDTIPNYTFDSIENPIELSELHTKYQKFNVFNIFYVNYILEKPICGLSGINTMIRKDCPGSITHEFGHNFGLAHTFSGNGVELVDGSNSDIAGDLIADTPSDPYVPFEKISDYLSGCEFISLKKDVNGQFYQPHTGNIMSYYGCDCGFTREQYLKMANVILGGYLNLW
ncbi:MAG: hypothetical protein HOP11_12045 [Saprospiraceae bacterium]|nr:hypothetical protein [Saprospiraceae bacterium]